MVDRNIFLSLFAVSLVFSACSDVEQRSNFTSELLSLKAEIRQMNNEAACYMRYPFRVRRSDSLLYILDLHASEAYCHSFKYPELDYLQSFAYRGEAPGHFLGADNIRVSPEGNIDLLDANKHQLSCLNTDDKGLRQVIKLPQKLIRSLDFAILSDSMFILTDYRGNHRFTVVNTQGEVVKDMFRIPVSKKEKTTGIPLAQAWRAFIDYNPHNGILAAVTQLGDVLEIYNLRNNSVVNIVLGEHGRPKYIDKGGYSVPDGIMGYSDVYVGDDKIYAVFWGTSFRDIHAGKEYKEGGKLLRVFDLKGKPLCQYELDRHITGFCVDEAEQKLIALDVNSNEPIVVYRLPINNTEYFKLSLKSFNMLTPEGKQKGRSVVDSRKRNTTGAAPGFLP